MEPDCDSLPGAGTTCGAAGAGGGSGLEPLGVDSCDFYVAEARRGFAQEFHLCVELIGDTPCSADYDVAVYDCVDKLTLRVCDSPEATSNCGSINCSELEAGECESLLKIYQAGSSAVGQDRIMDCYNNHADRDAAGCRDALRGCE